MSVTNPGPAQTDPGKHIYSSCKGHGLCWESTTDNYFLNLFGVPNLWIDWLDNFCSQQLMGGHYQHTLMWVMVLGGCKWGVSKCYESDVVNFMARTKLESHPPWACHLSPFPELQRIEASDLEQAHVSVDLKTWIPIIYLYSYLCIYSLIYYLDLSEEV